MKLTTRFGRSILLLAIFLAPSVSNAQPKVQELPRKRILMDFGWKFALGHPFDTRKDFNSATSYFSYLSKAGYGDGAAAATFDDRAWRTVNLPHDWCAELPFNKEAGHSHGYKAMGRNFPENSVGWYRKSFFVPAADLGKRISIEFDGVFRNSQVWVNGFYLGTHTSGYTSFCYDISEYLNYGGANVVAVRADATMEEGWYYEGAGIYRHVWLSKVAPLHVARYGTFVTSDLGESGAVVSVRTSVVNRQATAAKFDISEEVIDDSGKTVATKLLKGRILKAGDEQEFYTKLEVQNPQLWSVETPIMHTLRTTITSNGVVVDCYDTKFGIRTVRFDPDRGFFLNGKPLKIVGVNQHQDHAGVGVAIPDALQEWRIKQLKAIGCNGIRTSHNPPTPEMLDACDRLGMLVLDETRLMGINQEHFSAVEDLIKRDRNHPSVVLWSLGNEEWAIEGNIKGARIAQTMLNFAQRLDSSRSFTAAISGGWDNGIGTVLPVMGYNYIVQGDIDVHHAKFPWQAGIGTEESNTIGTRGIYADNRANGHMAATNRMPENVGTESGWQFYAARPFLSGLFFWTGFDYRGEPNPLVWPAVSSQFGLLDLCGFPKDIAFYLKSWWRQDPVLHISPHWNWKGDEGKEIRVTIYSNADDVELYLNGRSLGKKTMLRNGHLEWMVPYSPGVLAAKGYSKGMLVVEDKVETSGSPQSLALVADRTLIAANRQDVAVVTVSVRDSNGVVVPDADDELFFEIEGPGKIIGVGNGNPSSHEPDQFFSAVQSIAIEGLKELYVKERNGSKEVAGDFDDSSWKPAFGKQRYSNDQSDSLAIYRGKFLLPAFTNEAEITLMGQSVASDQAVYINGRLLAESIDVQGTYPALRIDHSLVNAGENVFAVVGKRFKKVHEWDELNTNPGVIQVVEPAKPWQRRLFNGFAQVIVQSLDKPGAVILKVRSGKLHSAKLNIATQLPAVDMPKVGDN